MNNTEREEKERKDNLPTFQELLEKWRKKPNWETIHTCLIEFVTLKQWVCWIAKPKINEKGEIEISKPPISPKTGKLVDVASTKPEKLEQARKLWGTFEEAKKFWETHTYVTVKEKNGSQWQDKKYPVCGIGIVLTLELGVVGVDLDHVIDSLEILLPAAQEIIKRLATYSEKSPSGKGVRSFSKGKKPGEECKQIQPDGWSVELYEKQRYVTVTGNQLLGTPNTIQHNQEGINWLYETYLVNPATQESIPLLESKAETESIKEEKSIKEKTALARRDYFTDNTLIEKARNARNGAKFWSLWNGQWKEISRSQSEAELALCSILAFWTDKDTSKIDRLFRQSLLYRQKWDEKHGNLTYGEITIDKAIATVTSTYNEKHRRERKGKKEKKNAKEAKQEKKRQEVIESTESAVYIGEKGEVIPGIAAKYFIENQAGNLIYYHEAFWRYKDGVWTEVKEKKIRQEIATMLGEALAKKSVIEDIIYLVTGLLFTDKPGLFDENHNLLNFHNGMLDINKEQLLPHNRNYFSTIQFPFDCPLEEIKEQLLTKRQAIIERLCPTWCKFLNELEFQATTYIRLEEWGGYCLTRETRIEKCLFLKGEGANGKSTFLEGIISVLRLWASDLELSQLFDKFKLAEIQGKLVNIATDIDTSHVIDPMFKKLVSGEEVEVEKKFKNPFRFRPFCKFMFSANDFIPTKDRSHGFFRRFDVIEFKKQFSEKERDETVKEIIKSGAEAQGIFCWMYWGLKLLIQNRWKMTPSEEFEATKQEFEMAANPLRQFIEECCVVNKSFNERGEPVFWVGAQVFRQKYVEWCREKGYEVLAENKLGREVKRFGFEHRRKRTPDGKMIWIYLGVAFTS